MMNFPSIGCISVGSRDGAARETNSTSALDNVGRR